MKLVLFTLAVMTHVGITLNAQSIQAMGLDFDSRQSLIGFDSPFRLDMSSRLDQVRLRTAHENRLRQIDLGQLGTSSSIRSGNCGAGYCGKLYALEGSQSTISSSTTALRINGSDGVSIRAHITGLDLAPNVSLLVMNHKEWGSHYEVYTGKGPHGDGTVWSLSMAGSELTFVIVNERLEPIATLDNKRFITVDQVFVADSDFAFPKVSHSAKPGSNNALPSCFFDANCATITSSDSLDISRRASVALRRIGATGPFCSATILNSGAGGTPTDRPLILTAAHCIDTSNYRSYEAIRYSSSQCGGEVRFPLPFITRVVDLLIIGDTSLFGIKLIPFDAIARDFAYLRLQEELIPSMPRAGWSTDSTLSETHFIFHHANGNHLQYAAGLRFGDNQRYPVTLYPSLMFIQNSNTALTGTAPGSSGSGIFNVRGQLIGILSAGPENSQCMPDNATIGPKFPFNSVLVEQTTRSIVASPSLITRNNCVDPSTIPLPISFRNDSKIDFRIRRGRFGPLIARLTAGQSSIDISPYLLNIVGTQDFFLYDDFTGFQVGQFSYTSTVCDKIPSLSMSGVVNAASFTAGPIAPGQLITIFGNNLGPDRLVNLQLTPDQQSVTNSLSGTRVLFDGIPAPIIYTSLTQVSAIVPFGLVGRSTVGLEVEYNGRLSNRIGLNVFATSPGIFTIDSSGRGGGAILNENTTLNTVSNPARSGTIVVLYATGAGQTRPVSVDGRIATGVASLTEPISVTIGGVNAEVLYAGPAPGIVNGVIQVNVRIPQTLQRGAHSIEIGSAGRNSQPGVFVFATSN